MTLTLFQDHHGIKQLEVKAEFHVCQVHTVWLQSLFGPYKHWLCMQKSWFVLLQCIPSDWLRKHFYFVMLYLIWFHVYLFIYLFIFVITVVVVVFLLLFFWFCCCCCCCWWWWCCLSFMLTLSFLNVSIIATLHPSETDVFSAYIISAWWSLSAHNSTEDAPTVFLFNTQGGRGGGQVHKW